MDKILFSNSFKNLMVALGAKTSDSSYAVPLINKTSGAPQGYMEMSALASVLGDAGKYPKYREKNLGASESVDLTLSTTMYVFLADTRYFNGIKIVLGATNTIKVVDQVWSQMNWDDVFSFSCTASTMTVTNISNSEKRLRYYLF